MDNGQWTTTMVASYRTLGSGEASTGCRTPATRKSIRVFRHVRGFLLNAFPVSGLTRGGGAGKIGCSVSFLLIPVSLW